MTPAEFAQQKRLEFPDLAGFSDQDIVNNFPVPFDSASSAPVAAPAPVEQSSAFDRFVASPAASVLSGFEGIASGLDTVAQIASRQEGFTPVKSTFELPGRALAAGEALVSGRDVGDFWAPVDTKAAIEGMKSSQYQQALTERAQAMDKAGSIFGSEGLGQAWAGIKETVTSPDLILDMVAAQLPQLAAMAATGGGTKVVTAVGAGLQGASSAADRLSEDAAKLKAMTPEQALDVPAIKSLVDEGSSLEDAKAAVMLNAATMTLGLSTVGSLLATKLTGGQLEKLIGRLASGVPVKAVGTVGESALKEFGQEALEEATGQLASNIGAQQISPETELMEGVLAAAGLGGVGGAIIGGGLSGIVGGQSVAAPAAVPARAAATPATPAYSYGDIIAPSEGQNYFIALATIDGQETQFMGDTQAAAEARRDEAVAKLAPPAEEASVETPDQIVRRGLMDSGLKADQIAQLTAEQAEELFNNIALREPDITDAANAQAVEARSVALANAMVNFATAKKTEFDVQAQESARQAELVKQRATSQAELDSIVAKSQVALDKIKTQSAQWQAKAAEAAAKIEEFKARAAQAKESVKIKGKGIVVGPEKNVADLNAAPLGQAPGAVVDPSLPKVDLNVATGPVTAGPVATGPVTAGPVATGPVAAGPVAAGPVAKTFAAPKQTITPSTKLGIPPVYYPEVGSAPIVPKTRANKKNTWFAAVFADTQGNQIAVPVIKVGEKPTLRVYLDSRGVKEALGNIIGGNLTRNVEATAAKAAEVGYPLDNKITLEEFAASRGLTFLNAFIRSEQPLNAGEHALPAGLVIGAPSAVAPVPVPPAAADKVDAAPTVESPTPAADTKRKLSEAELVLMYLRREVGGDLDKLAAALFTKTGVAVDPIEFFTKLNVGKDVPTVIREAAKNGPLAFDLLTSLRRAFASDQAMSYDDSSFAAPTAEDVVVTLNEIIETGLTITEDKGSGAAGKDDKAVAPKRADKASSAKAGLARLTATNSLKTEPEFPHSLAANDAAFTAFSVGDYTRAAWAYRQAAALVLEERGGDGAKRAILFHKYADKALVETARVYKSANREFVVPNYLKQVVIEETQDAPEDTRYDLDEDTITGLINSLSIGAFTRVTEGKDVFTFFVPPDVDAVAAALTRAENSKSVKAQTWAKAVRESGMTAEEIAARFAVAAVRATDQESRAPDPMLLATNFSALITGPKKVAAEVAHTNRPLTPNETTELSNYRTETDTISLLRDLAAQGLNTSFTALTNALAGRFTAGHVAVFADNATRASLSTFSVALHEAAHHFTSKLPPAARLALQRSVAQLSARISGTPGIDPRVGFKSYAEYLASRQNKKVGAEAMRSTDKPLPTPTGKPSKLNPTQQRQVRSAEFKAWFGDWQNDPANASKVVDPETGEPKVVYHGTMADFTKFDLLRASPGLYGVGIYTTDSKDVAGGDSGYAYKGGYTNDDVVDVVLGTKVASAPEALQLWAKTDLPKGESIEDYIAVGNRDGDYDIVEEVWVRGAKVMPLYAAAKDIFDVDKIPENWRAEAQRAQVAVNRLYKDSDYLLDLGYLERLEEERNITNNDIYANIVRAEGSEGDRLGKNRVNLVLSQLGYDSIKHTGGLSTRWGGGTAHSVVVALNTDQVKSAIGNTGAFSATDADITRTDKTVDEGPTLSAEAWAEEVIAEAAALNGISAPVARTLWAAIMRQFKLLSLRVNMYMQEQFLGPDAVNPEFAQKWVDTQIEASIAGDHLRLMSLLDRYAKIRPTLGKMVINQLDERHHWQSQQMNPLTGELSYLGSLENTSSATESRIYQTVAAFKQQAMQAGSWHRAENEAALAGIVNVDKSAPVNPTIKLATIMLAKATETAEVEIASHNELLKPFMAAWAKAQSIMPVFTEHSRALNKRLGMPVPEALTIERFAQLAGFDLETVKAAKAALAQVIKDEMKVTPPADFADKLATNLADLKSPGATAAAQQLIYNGSRKSANRSGSKLAAGQSRLMELEALQLRTAAKLAKFTTDPKDWGAIDKDISEKIAESFKQILKAKDSFGDAEVQMADVASMMDKAMVEKEVRAEFDKNAQDIFAKANIGGITLHSMLRDLMSLNSDNPYYKYQIDFNWDARRIYDTVVSYVTEHPNSALAELTTQELRGRVRGTAILASLIKYARDNELAIELARAATIKGAAETKLLLEYQEFMRTATDKKLDELAALQKERKAIPTNRFIQKALNARDKFIKASDDIAVLKQELAALRLLNGVFLPAKKIAEDVLGAQNEIYTHHPEAVFAHPTSPDDKIEDVYSSPRVKKVGERSNAELRQVIQDVREYLDANRDQPEGKGELFNRLQRQNTAMIQAISAPDKVRNARSGLVGALIEGTAGLFRTVGSPSGDRVAARITNYSSIIDVLRNPAKKISSDYERSAAAFRKAAGGISDTEFLENFFTEASNLAQVLNADREEIHARIDERFSANEAIKDVWAKPGAKKAFWAFLDSVERCAEGAQKMQADHGADLVEDPTTGGYRKQIRRGYLTFPQHTNATLKTWASAVPIQFSADEDKGNIFTTYKLAANAAELREGMAKFLGKDGWNIFMAPLLSNDLKGVKGPAHADGTNYNLSTDRAKTLVALANGDFFRFAELAYADTPGSTQTLNEYTNTLIEEVGKVWKQVATHAVDKATVESLRVNPGIPNIGIDARATQTWPIGWKSPMQFNEDGMRRFTAGVAGVSAFGRDMGETLLDIGAMGKDIDRRIAEIKAKYNKPGLTNREQMTDWNLPKRVLTALGVSSSDWQQLNALEEYKKVKWSERITRSLNPDTTLGLNDKLSMEFWSTYVMQLTAGFRSALKNPVSGLNQFALAGEFSADSVKDTLGNYGQLLKQTAASVAQTLPFVDPMRSDMNMQAMYAMGVYDSVTDTNLSDSLKGGLSSTGEHHPVVTFLRRAKEVYKDTRFGFSKGKRGVAVRAFDWFNWSQLTTQLGAVSNNLNIYYEIVQRMADYGRSGGSLLVTPNAKQIGLRGSEARYNNMMRAWTEGGGSDILTLAAELAQNPAMSELEVKKRLVPTINKIVSDRISASSSISANPAWVNSSRAGRIAGTFFSWTIRQGGTIAKPFVDAQTNQVSAATLMRGAGMVALGMLPGVLAYSMLLDMFDDMTERKRDKVELRLNSQQSKDNFVQSLVEAIQDVGVFSLPGDLATTLVSAYQGTGNKGPSFSLDNRLVAVSTFNNFTKLFRDLMVYGPQNMVLSTSGLQAIQAMGGTAWLSNLETLNRMTGADVGGILATYGERQDRVSVNNYIREAGRIEGLPVRSFSGTGSTNPPSPMSPWITEMQLAALTRDEARFDKAKEQAYQLALKDSPNPKEAWTKVAKRYASKHPLRGAFEDKITPMEIQRVVDRIEVTHPGKSKMVQEALVDFNRFGARVPLFRPVLGAKPSAASIKRSEEIRAKKNQPWF